MTASTDDDRNLERFIDGELSFAEQRALLRRVELMPDGWRRLALGLLEDQAFRHELQRQPARNSRQDVSPPTLLPAVAIPSRRDVWAGRLTIAVMCLLCFAAGHQWKLSREAGPARVGPEASSRQVADVPRPSSTPVMESPITAPEVTDSGVTDDDVDDAPQLLATAGEASSLATMKVVFPDWPDDGQPVEVPVVESSDEDAVAWLEQSAVPEDVRQQWEAAGYLIHEERKYVPVPLKDGRQGIAPVSDVVVEYIGTKEFQ